MTTIITRAALAAALLLIGAAGVARAESLDVKVPFPFVVHGQTLPAGDAPVLTFTKSETRYRLADIWESATKGGTVLN